jgi:hypothetical protein
MVCLASEKSESCGKLILAAQWNWKHEKQSFEILIIQYVHSYKFTAEIEPTPVSVLAKSGQILGG